MRSGITRMAMGTLAVLLLACATMSFSQNKKTNPSETGETYIGGAVADAMKAATGADAAIVSGGSLGFENMPDAVTPETVSKIVPFEGDSVVVSKIKGSALKSALEKSYSLLPRRSSSFLQVSGISVAVDLNEKPGARITNIKIKGAAIKPDSTYTIAMTDFLANGGGGLTDLRKGELTDDEPMPLEQVILDNISYDKKSIGKAPGRITVIEAEEE